jgi:YHS domain-containing protein
MFIRLLIFVIVAVLVYRAFKSWVDQGQKTKVMRNDRTPLQADDVMRQDPQCGVYISQRDAVVLHHNGEELYFCSEACKDKFLEQN